MSLSVGNKVFLSPKGEKGKTLFKHIECGIGIGKMFKQGNVYVWQITAVEQTEVTTYTAVPLGINGLDLSKHARKIVEDHDPNFQLKKLIGA